MASVKIFPFLTDFVHLYYSSLFHRAVGNRSFISFLLGFQQFDSNNLLGCGLAFVCLFTFLYISLLFIELLDTLVRVFNQFIQILIPF